MNKNISNVIARSVQKENPTREIGVGFSVVMTFFRGLFRTPRCCWPSWCRRARARVCDARPSEVRGCFPCTSC